VLRDDSGRIVAYVWQYPKGGYVVTSADKRIEPVIMEAPTGFFPKAQPNPVASFVIWDMVARLEAIRMAPQANQPTVRENTESWDSLASKGVPPTLATATWGPLIPTLWSQAGRYNDKCPSIVPWYIGGPRRLVGCVATATSQLLNFWQYPKSMTFTGDDEYTDSHGIDFDSEASKYSFPSFSSLNALLADIAYDDSDEEVATLCFAVGVKLRSNYSAFGGTGASTAYVDDVLRGKFGFGSAQTLSSSVLNWGSYESMAIENIQKGQPLQIAIHKASVSDPANHSVLLDGYKDAGPRFHINFGWGDDDDGATAWYDLPSSYSGYNAIHTIVYDISTYYGWPQHGSDQYNQFRTVYGVPTSRPHPRYTRTTDEHIQGFIIGEGNWIFATHNPLIINDPAYHPRVTAVDQYGTLVRNVEVAATSSTISEPVQAPNGDVFFGAGDGIYRFRPQAGSVIRVYRDAGNEYYGDSTPRIDRDGHMYFGSSTTLVSIDQTGVEQWRWSVPAGGVMYTGIPSVDSERENVYVGYWQDSTDEAVLVCINRSTGVTRYSKTFGSIPSADRGIHTPAVGSDGTVYASVRTRIYALTPHATTFSEKWVQDKLYAKYQPIALGVDDSVYTEYWTMSGGNYYLTLAKLDPDDGTVVWERPKPDVGTYSGFVQPVVAGNSVVLFPVYWDSSPNDTWHLYAYTTDGEFLWDYTYSPASVYDMAVAAGQTLCIAKNDGAIVGLSDGQVGDPRSGGMGYSDNAPPAEPLDMTPTNMAVLTTQDVELLWTCLDSDGHALKYDVFLGRATTNDVGGDLVPLTNDATSASFTLEGLEPGATYLWMVQATDGQALSYSAIQSFTVADIPIDSDGDGIPDSWELRYTGSTTNMDAHGHSDSDGIDNYDEWVADTDPTDEGDYFHITTNRHVLDGVLVCWPSSASRVYDIYHSTNLLSDPAFRVIAYDLPGTPPVNCYTDTVHDADVQGFYRIGVKLEPLSWEVSSVNGRWYALTTSTGSWDEVESEAVARGGHLATIRSQAENDWLLQTFDAPDPNDLWIGLFQTNGSPEPNGGWQWVSGEPVSYLNWSAGEPNDNGGENHAAFKGPRTSAPGKWNDARGDGMLHGLIEKMAP